MKKLLYTLIAFAIVFTSCDIDRSPEWRQNEDNISPESFDMILNGCYAQIKGWSDVMHRAREYPADNIVIRGTSSDKFMSFITYLPVTDNGRLESYWGNSLRVIQRTSTLINTTDVSDPVVADKIGEAYYLRGLCYFYMVNTWGKPYFLNPETNLGVPIVNNYNPVTDNPTTLPDRSTVKEVYDQAISDMKMAAQMMNGTGRGAAYASKHAAWAMLSRIYLYMGGTWDSPVAANNELAVKYADSVINSGKYAMLSHDNFKNYNTYAPSDNAQTETIFAITYIVADNISHAYSIGAMYARINGSGWGEMYASEKYLQLLKHSTREAKAKGGDVDARGSFIKPQFSLDSKGNTIPAFRFIVPQYSVASETATPTKIGYAYRQFALKLDAGGNPVVPMTFTERVKVNFDPKDTITRPITYTIEHIQDNDYKVTNYQVYVANVFCTTGTYEGEKDYLMILNLNTYPQFYIYKCSQQNNNGHLYSPTVSRLAEMYLNAAEAYIKMGNNAAALPYLNIIRERATKSEYTLAELNADAKGLVSKERQLEFAFEAHRTQDVFRNGETMYREYPGPHFPLRAYPATSSRTVQYIPQAEINAYIAKLTQNTLNMDDHITLP